MAAPTIAGQMAGTTPASQSQGLSRTQWASSEDAKRAVTRAREAAIRGALIGFTIRGGLNLIRPPRRRTEGGHNALKDTLQFTAFLGALGFTYVGVEESLSALFGQKRTAKWRALVAGAVAGHTLLLTGSKTRHYSLATYILLRGLTLLIRCGNKPPGSTSDVQPGTPETGEAAASPSLGLRLRRLLHTMLAPTRWTHGDVVLMCLASSQIIYSFIVGALGSYRCPAQQCFSTGTQQGQGWMMPSTLPKSYIKFIQRQAAKEPYVWRAVQEQAVRNWQGKPPGPLRHLHGTQWQQDVSNATPCHFWHPEQGCIEHAITNVPSSYVRALAVYLPVYLVPAILVHRHKLLKDPGDLVPKIATGVARSAAFLTSFIGLAFLGACAGFNLTGTSNGPIIAASTAAGGLAVLVEKKSRRMELALYCLSRAAESFSRCLVELKVVPQWAIPDRIDVLLFAAGCAAIMHCYSDANGRHRDVFRSKYLNVLDAVFGNTGVHEGSIQHAPSNAEIARSVTARLRSFSTQRLQALTLGGLPAPALHPSASAPGGALAAAGLSNGDATNQATHRPSLSPLGPHLPHSNGTVSHPALLSSGMVHHGQQHPANGSGGHSGSLSPSSTPASAGSSWHGARPAHPAATTQQLLKAGAASSGNLSTPEAVFLQSHQGQDSSTAKSTAGSSTASLAHLLPGGDSEQEQRGIEQPKPQQEAGHIDLCSGLPQPYSLGVVDLAGDHQQQDQGRSAQQSCTAVDALPFRAGSVMRLSQIEQEGYGVQVIAPPPSVLYKVQMGSGEPAEVRPLDSFDSQDMLPIPGTVPLHQVLLPSADSGDQQPAVVLQPQGLLPASLDMLGPSAVQQEVVSAILRTTSEAQAPLQPVSSLTSLSNIGPQSILPMQVPGISSVAALPRIHRAPGRVASVSKLGAGTGFRQAEGSAGSVEGPVRGGAPRGSGGGAFGNTMRRIATTPAGLNQLASQDSFCAGFEFEETPEEPRVHGGDATRGRRHGGTSAALTPLATTSTPAVVLPLPLQQLAPGSTLLQSRSEPQTLLPGSLPTPTTSQGVASHVRLRQFDSAPVPGKAGAPAAPTLSVNGRTLPPASQPAFSSSLPTILPGASRASSKRNNAGGMPSSAPSRLSALSETVAAKTSIPPSSGLPTKPNGIAASRSKAGALGAADSEHTSYTSLPLPSQSANSSNGSNGVPSSSLQQPLRPLPGPKKGEPTTWQGAVQLQPTLSSVPESTGATTGGSSDEGTPRERRKSSLPSPSNSRVRQLRAQFGEEPDTGSSRGDTLSFTHWSATTIHTARAAVQAAVSAQSPPLGRQTGSPSQLGDMLTALATSSPSAGEREQGLSVDGGPSHEPRMEPTLRGWSSEDTHYYREHPLDSPTLLRPPSPPAWGHLTATAPVLGDMPAAPLPSVQEQEQVSAPVQEEVEQEQATQGVDQQPAAARLQAKEPSRADQPADPAGAGLPKQATAGSGSDSGGVQAVRNNVQGDNCDSGCEGEVSRSVQGEESTPTEGGVSDQEEEELAGGVEMQAQAAPEAAATAGEVATESGTPGDQSAHVQEPGGQQQQNQQQQANRAAAGGGAKKSNKKKKSKKGGKH